MNILTTIFEQKINDPLSANTIPNNRNQRKNKNFPLSNTQAPKSRGRNIQQKNLLCLGYFCSFFTNYFIKISFLKKKQETIFV